MTAALEKKIAPTPPLTEAGHIPEVIVNKGLRDYSLSTGRRTPRTALTHILTSGGYTSDQITATYRGLRLNNKTHYGYVAADQFRIAQQLDALRARRIPRRTGQSQRPDAYEATIAHQGALSRTTLSHILESIARGHKRTGRGNILSNSRIRNVLLKHGIPEAVIARTLHEYKDELSELKRNAKDAAHTKGKKGTPRRRVLPPAQAQDQDRPLKPAAKATILTPGTISVLVHSTRTGEPRLDRDAPSRRSAAEVISRPDDASHEPPSQINTRAAQQVSPRPVPQTARSIRAVSEASSATEVPLHSVDLHISHDKQSPSSLNTPDGSLALSPLETQIILLLIEDRTYKKTSIIAEQVAMSPYELGIKMKSLRIKIDDAFPFPIVQKVKRGRGSHVAGNRTSTSRHRINPQIQMNVIE